ncbi:urea ABC transporter, permease protein UrtB [Klebsiella pneumoniae]|nr:urea ABC transporter, permease protein UrtB [Klebsiella pneumoniae]SXL79389.1 urea ABC transporter, permease protein UrtB [Klebsiella pneumoniae]
MNALRLMNVLALLLILLPWRAQAAEADDFVAASRSQQAQLLSQGRQRRRRIVCRCCGR